MAAPTDSDGAQGGVRLQRYAWLSIGAAVTTILLKSTAAWITGSVGLLSDAFESGVNLVAAVVALVALKAAARPPTTHHHFGLGKAEYMSAAVEGSMILVAAVAILWTAVDRLVNPQPIEQLGVGLVISAVAAAINLAVGLLLVRTGRRHRSITLEADGKHLLTDVWTSGGVIVAVGVVALTGWQALDPIIAIAVGINILFTGYTLLRRSGAGLLDVALPTADQASIAHVVAEYEAQGVRFHALRTREAGQHRFVYVHVLVPGDWTVQRGHDLCERFERDLALALPGTTTFTHLEPVEDPVSYADQELGDTRFRGD
ncbi:MAG: cation diffusion facilitator family transporter [Jiangellales bacterium]